MALRRYVDAYLAEIVEQSNGERNIEFRGDDSHVVSQMRDVRKDAFLKSTAEFFFEKFDTQ